MAYVYVGWKHDIGYIEDAITLYSDNSRTNQPGSQDAQCRRETTPLDLADDEGSYESWTFEELPYKSRRHPAGYTFGFLASNDVVLPRGKHVSRDHFELYLNDNLVWMVRDLSANGLRVNGDWITGKRATANRGNPSKVALERVALHPEKDNVIVAGGYEIILRIDRFPYGVDPHTRYHRPPRSGTVTSVAGSPSGLEISQKATTTSHHILSRPWSIKTNNWPASLKCALPKSGDAPVLARVAPLGNRKQVEERFAKLYAKMSASGWNKSICMLLGDGTGGEPRQTLLLSEYIRSANYIDEGDWDHIELESFFALIMNALTYIHSLGIVHRDLKPAAVLICDDTAKLAGFSEATILDKPGASTIGVVGDPHYRAPEMDSGPYDGRADVYSICRLIHDLLDSNPDNTGLKTQTLRSALRTGLERDASK